MQGLAGRTLSAIVQRPALGTETVVDTALTEDTGTAADTALAVQNRPAAVPANHKGEYCYGCGKSGEVHCGS